MTTDAGSASPLGLNRPVREQLATFERLILQNPIVDTVLARAPALALPGCYLTAGCLFQTIWNVVCGFAPTHAIRDYDLFYCDPTDLSWDAEDVVIRRCAALFADLPATVEVRNQARVHLWYAERFGVACPPHASSEAAINTFAATTCCVAARRTATDHLIVYAPHGFNDLFGLVVRPNPILAPAAVYTQKAARWQAAWPRLRVLPWPASG